ncbi:unnamed protein product [Enterobius vermicularis]|uniref:ShTK domain protein n=1 Tax=Enterobius vermicularis TaxID=51028 RepID=A0A0N4V589_ENTVE|nr:unnamed protein product [Enterobius vermicularis]
MTCCRDPAYQCENNRNSRLNCTGIAEAGGCITEVPWIALMLQQECPHSCGLCEISSCVDENELCPLLSEICNHKSWFQFMEEMCPRTCNSCKKNRRTTTSLTGDYPLQ